MSLVVTFEVRGELAHFRRPDTLGTHASYPFPTRTVLRGLIAAILGEESWQENGRVGLRLLAPVRSVTQQLSMHGKTWEAGSGRPDSFHRPTTIELVVRPHYRVYAAGSFADQLAGMIRNRKSVYPTYLGSAFCLTHPRWVAANESMPQTPLGPVACVSVVPTPAARPVVEAGGACSRVGGVSLDHLGPFADRRFRGTTAVFYEPGGRPLTVEPVPAEEGSFWEFHNLPGEGLVCLW